jgi:hypothetical protein
MTYPFNSLVNNPTILAEKKKQHFWMNFLQNDDQCERLNDWEVKRVDDLVKKAQSSIAQTHNIANIEENNRLLSHQIGTIVLNAQKEYQEMISENDKRLQSGSGVAAAATFGSQKKSSFTLEELKKHLNENKGSHGNAMLTHIIGNTDSVPGGKAAKLLNNGLIIAEYSNERDFEKHVANATRQKSYGSITSMTGHTFKSLVSVAEISPQGKPSSYKVVISDVRGVRVCDIDKATYDTFVNDKALLAGESNQLGNRAKFANKILSEFGQDRTDTDKNMKEELMNQCKNDKLFGFIPVPGIIGGRKDKLRSAVKTSGFTFLNRESVVVESCRLNDNRKIVTINGEPDKNTLIPISIKHRCYAEIDGEGRIAPDKIVYFGRDGARKDVDISGDSFRLPLTVRGPLVEALRFDTEGRDYSAARKAAQEVMKKFNKLEIVVCKDENMCMNKESVASSYEGEEREIGMSFMAKGKTHGMKLSGKEKGLAVVAGVLTTVGLGLATAGASVAATAVGAAAVAATTTVGSLATASAGASSLKGVHDFSKDVKRGKIKDEFPNAGIKTFRGSPISITNNQRVS